MGLTSRRRSAVGAFGIGLGNLVNTLADVPGGVGGITDVVFLFAAGGLIGLAVYWWFHDSDETDPEPGQRVVSSLFLVAGIIAVALGFLELAFY